MHMCWKHVRRCTGACIRPEMCGIESRGECMSVCGDKSSEKAGIQGRTQHSSKVANEPPSKNQPAFFSLFAFSHHVFLQMNRKRMGLTGVLLQHSNCNCDLEVAGETATAADGLDGARVGSSISRSRSPKGVNEMHKA